MRDVVEEGSIFLAMGAVVLLAAFACGSQSTVPGETPAAGGAGDAAKASSGAAGQAASPAGAESSPGGGAGAGAAGGAGAGGGAGGAAGTDGSGSAAGKDAAGSGTAGEKDAGAAAAHGAGGGSAAPAAVAAKPDPVMDVLAGCVRDSAARAIDPRVRVGLLARLAAVEAQGNPVSAAQQLKSLKGTGGDVKVLSDALMRIASRDLETAVKVAEEEEPGPLRDAFITSVARAIVKVAPDRALSLASKVEPRLARETLLLDLVDVALEDGPSKGDLIAEQIVEPIYSDLADCMAAVRLARTDPAAGVLRLDKVESPMVRTWGYMQVSEELAARDPQAALQMERLLPSVYYRDELYERLLPSVLAADVDKGLALALRISDKQMRERAVVSVCREMFKTKPGLALLVLEKNVEATELESLQTGLLVASCVENGKGFAGRVEEVRGQLPVSVLGEALAQCCQRAPGAVKEAAGALGVAPDDALRRCFLCGGVSDGGQQEAGGIADPYLRASALSCVAVRLASTSVQDALEVVKLLPDGVARDATRLEIVQLLLAAKDGKTAERVASGIQSPYPACMGLLARMEFAPAAEAGQMGQLVEAHLPRVQDGWRRDQVLARLARLESRWDLGRALDHAGLILDLGLQQEVLDDMTRQWVKESGMEKAVAQREQFLDLAARGLWCIHLAEIRASGQAEAAPVPAL